MGHFKNWLLGEFAVGSDGMRDNQATQTNQATTQAAQKWLGQPSNAGAQTQLLTGAKNRSAMGNNLMQAATDAVQAAPATVAKKTTAPAVAGALQQQLGLPKVIQPKPGGMFMRKK